MSLSRAKRKATTLPNGRVEVAFLEPTIGKDGKSRRPPATAEEVLKAWEKKDAGASIQDIALDLKRAEITTVPNGTVVKGKDGRTYRNSYLPETIAKAIELQSKGKTIAAIAREVEAPYMTVSRWLKKPRPESATPVEPPALAEVIT
jgi:hypothetical protein